VATKAYFFGLCVKKREISYKDVISIKTKRYEIEVHDEAWMIPDNSLMWFQSLNPTINWIATKISYFDKKATKSIELIMATDHFLHIEKKAQLNDFYKGDS
jgi:hypothetical protein